ncbi:MAG: 50S ribosomal protein L7/L12 [Candidatus Zixiibacteriota bacterium]
MTTGSDKPAKKLTTKKPEGPSKEASVEEASSNVEQVIGIIERMSVLELAELTKSLQEKFGVSAAVPVAQVQAAGGASEAAPPAEEQTEFSAVLSVVGEKKIQVIKVVRELTGLGLKEAKDVVDGAPKPVKEGVSKEEAEKIKAKLTEVGATVEIK